MMVMCPSVYGLGVWRLLHLEFTRSDEEVFLDLIQDTNVCQPENCGFYLYELLDGISSITQLLSEMNMYNFICRSQDFVQSELFF